jgi:hypothetical protein
VYTPPAAGELNKEFEQEDADPVHKCDPENAFGRTVFSGIDIIREEGDISHQAPDAIECDQLLVLEKEGKEFAEIHV